MKSFIALHKDWHLEDAHLIDAYFDARAFEEELESLPGDYVPPRGQLLVQPMALRRARADVRQPSTTARIQSLQHRPFDRPSKPVRAGPESLAGLLPALD